MITKYYVGILVCLACLSFVSASNATLEVSVNYIPPEPDRISVEVPDSLDFGNVSAGEESDVFDVYINNTGNVDITVTPVLDDGSEEIFKNLAFRRTQNDDFADVGDFSVNISAPSSGDDVKSQRTYAMLDLTNYSEDLGNETFASYSSDVIYWAVAQ